MNKSRDCSQHFAEGKRDPKGSTRPARCVRRRAEHFDPAWAASLLRERFGAAVWSERAPTNAAEAATILFLERFAALYIRLMIHVGIGYDVHGLVEGRKLVLGGVEIKHTKGLDGHSDADVLMHAICDAVFGALGEGDIGHFFPNTDSRWKGAPSKVFLQEAARQVSFHEATIVNIDATLIAQQPKLSNYITSMKNNIAVALNINVKKIGIKATTNENLGFLGRGEGVAAMAVASVDLPP